MVIRAVIREDMTELDAERASKIIKKPREECKMVLDAVIEDRRNHRRQPKPEPPEGGISLRAAEKAYGIGNRTLSAWARAGYLPIKKRTKNELYVDEARLAQIIEAYKSLPDNKRRTIKKAIAAL